MRKRDADRLYHRVNHLFDETLMGGIDSDRPWGAVTALRRMGSYIVFEKARIWCESPMPRKRMRAASILSQLRRPLKIKPRIGSVSEPVFQGQSFALISKMVQSELDLYALQAQIFAFGHLDNLAAVPLITQYVDHPHADIRYALAFTLGSLHKHPDSVPALAKLADDSDKDVRNWAIFGLGVLGDADSEEIRQLFLAHLSDPFAEVRVEAVASLGKRKDARVVPKLIRMIANEGPGSVYLEAARKLLEMDEDPPNWYAKEYIEALQAKFPAQAAN